MLRLPEVRRRHHVRPGDRAPRLRRRRRVARRPRRRHPPLHHRRRGRLPAASASGSTRPWSRPSTGTTTACSSGPDAGAARGYLRSRGIDGDIVRRYRLGWAPAAWDELVRGLRLPDDVLVATGLGFKNRVGPLHRRVPGPAAVPDLRPRGPGRRHRRAHPPRRRRPQVQELAGDRALQQVPRALRPQLAQVRHRRPRRRRRGDRLRGLHRRHRLRPGRHPPGGGHVRHRAHRGPRQAARPLRQAHRPRLRRRRRRPGRRRPLRRLGEPLRARGLRRRPPRGAGPRRPGPARPGAAAGGGRSHRRVAAGHRRRQALPRLPPRPGARRRRPHLGRGPGPGGHRRRRRARATTPTSWCATPTS